MPSKKSYVFVIITLILLPLVIFGLKFNYYKVAFSNIIPRDIYQVTLNLECVEPGDKAFFRTYFPTTNERQKVLYSLFEDSINWVRSTDESGTTVKYIFNDTRQYRSGFSYKVEVKRLEYKIASGIPLSQSISNEQSAFILPEKYIQSDDIDIQMLADSLKQEGLLGTLESNFRFVESISNSTTSIQTDAIRALDLKMASCNGKSRLLTAICRAQGLEARVAGGLILEHGNKKTSHSWTEINLDGDWVPFDAMNGHFASLPSNYLELYKGDKFLLSYSKGLDFDYLYTIEKRYQDFIDEKQAGFHLWHLLASIHMPMNLLRTFLLLPIAALLIVIFRNVVGLKTIGVLLPALIGLALINVNIVTGLITFVIVIGIVSLLHMLLSKWSLLYVPQLGIILTCVILSILIMGVIGARLEMQSIEMAVFLPIVIISITAERFAKILVDDNARDAFKALFNTFFLALISCLIFKSKFLLGLLLTYPELYLSIILIMMVLGRWIGMRVTEYKRFSYSLSEL